MNSLHDPQKKLRVAIVVRAFPVISETFVLEHVTGLLDRGHQVSVFCFRSNTEMGQHGLHSRYNLKKITHCLEVGDKTSQSMYGRAMQLVHSPLRLAKSWRRLQGNGRRRALLLAGSDLCRTNKFDVCHAHFAGEGDATAWLRADRLMECPLVVSVHGYDITTNRGAGRPLYRFLFDFADVIVTTTRFMLSATTAIGCPDKKLFLLPSGIDISQFEWRARNLRPGETLSVLTIARLVEVKGVEYAVRAIALLKSVGVKISYSVIGDGPLREKLESLSLELGVADRVKFLGAQPREAVIEHFRTSHLFLMPSCTASTGNQEAQGIAALEAQACGLPVVASRSGGIPEVVQDGVSGLLVPEKNPLAIAEAVLKLIELKDQWPNMGRKGRDWVEAHFQQSQHIAKIEALYRSLLVSNAGDAL